MGRGNTILSSQPSDRMRGGRGWWMLERRSQCVYTTATFGLGKMGRCRWSWRGRRVRRDLPMDVRLKETDVLQMCSASVLQVEKTKGRNTWSWFTHSTSSHSPQWWWMYFVPIRASHLLFGLLFEFENFLLNMVLKGNFKRLGIFYAWRTNHSKIRYGPPGVSNNCVFICVFMD